MAMESLVDDAMSSRDLVRTLRISASRGGEAMPESVLWHAFVELRRRRHEGAEDLFLIALKSLHSRRSISGSDLPVHDTQLDEHRMVDDPLLSELWKAYKRCIRSHRTGPAGQLLKEIEDRIKAH